MTHTARQESASRTTASQVLDRRSGVRLTFALPLVGVTGAIAAVLALSDLPVSPPGSVGWIVAVTVAVAGVRLVGARHDDDRWRLGCYLANLTLAALGVWLSPVFGLYAFVGFFEASLLPRRLGRLVGLVGTAAVVAVAQTGGPRSEIFVWPFYALFFGITLTIALLMSTLDRTRERLMLRLEEANSELRAAQERTASLTDQLVDQAREAGVADERKRLSREIHDTVAQDLVAIIAQLDAVSDEDDPAERQRCLGVVEATARAALSEARRAVAALASPRLDDTDLPLALDDLLGQWRESTGLGGELTVTGRPATTGHDDDLIRVAQEALSNVAKHARARRADVGLAYAPGSVGLTITDDGVGFDPDATSGGFGLPGVRDRLDRIGGRLVVHSSTDGTTLVAELPLMNGATP